MISLWSTVVGSHIWSMNTAESDVDVCTVYQVPTAIMLRGEHYEPTRPQLKYLKDGIEHDEVSWEVGHLVNQLLKGNINALWQVTSPIVLQESEHLKALRQIVLENLSARTYYSCRGMTMSQWGDVEKRDLGAKGRRTAWRTATFGIALLEGHGVVFEAAPEIVNSDMIRECIRRLDDAKNLTSLPETPDSEPFRRYLYKLRMENLCL